MTERPRRRGFWGFVASDPRTALTLLVVPVVFAFGPSWPRFWAMLAVLAVCLAAYAWWARGHD